MPRAIHFAVLFVIIIFICIFFYISYVTKRVKILFTLCHLVNMMPRSWVIYWFWYKTGVFSPWFWWTVALASGKEHELLAGERITAWDEKCPPQSVCSVTGGAGEGALWCTPSSLLLLLSCTEQMLMEQSCRKGGFWCLSPMLSFYTYFRVLWAVQLPLSLIITAVFLSPEAPSYQLNLAVSICPREVLYEHTPLWH